jgi:M6 family metalloprotease-like protein
MASIPGAITPAPPQRETVGEFVGLCLLIQFPDVPGTISQAEVDRFCNQNSYNGFGNNGSVRDYFHDVSGGRLDYRNLVTPYYTAKHPRSYYTNEAIEQPVRARQLIKEALEYFQSRGLDFSSLTADSQGFIYATNVLYAGKRVNGWAKGLWPHSFHLLTPWPLGPGKSVNDYQITDMTDELTLGTFCHENGHMICDFPDLYDYGQESAGVGAYCLMCAGANVSEKNPIEVNPYLKYRAGWAQEVVRITPNIHGQLQAGTNRFFIHRKNATEYFVVENRCRQGRDRMLPAQGLAIWHIDELGDNGFEQMTPTQHYECSLVQADGRLDLEANPHNLGDATDLFGAGGYTSFTRLTTPNSAWWDGTPSGLAVTEISAPHSLMTFDATV